MLNKNLEMCCKKENTYFRAAWWIEGDLNTKEAVVCSTCIVCIEIIYFWGVQKGVQVLSTPKNGTELALLGILSMQTIYYIVG